MCESYLFCHGQITILFGSEWADAGRLLHACVASTARAVAPDPSAVSDLTEALFAVLHAITKKRPQYMDWLDDLLSELVELGECCSIHAYTVRVRHVCR